MTDHLEDSGHWRDSVETRLVKLEVTVGEQARLRAAMDEDLSKLHVERKLLQALQDTQSDHTRQLTRLETKVDTVEKRLVAVEGRLGAVEGTLQKVHVGVEAIRDMLGRDLAGDN